MAQRIGVRGFRVRHPYSPIGAVLTCMGLESGIGWVHTLRVQLNILLYTHRVLLKSVCAEVHPLPVYAQSATLCTKAPPPQASVLRCTFTLRSGARGRVRITCTSLLEGALCKEKGFRVDFEVWSTRTSQPRVTSASPRCGWVRAVRRGACHISTVTYRRHISTVTYRRHISTVAYRRGRGLDSRERDVSGSCVTLGIVYS